MVRYRDRNYFAHIIQHDYVFHPDEWQLEAKPVQQSTKRKNKLGVAAGLILLAMVLVFQGMINGALFRLF
ncbi:hypothetical protein [Enterococcus casseliflavus]|uniref:hypothetical protein n=1 Tax=Enterococcus casseliflavus TaxID=37734 RepID=UPI001FCC214D|nr:hypothetical protein [Enterococcus casseliflavus]